MSMRERQHEGHTATIVCLLVAFTVVCFAVRACYEVLNYLGKRCVR